MNVVVATSDNHLWCLEPFAYLFNKYWSPNQKVMIAGYKKPEFVLPDNFTFYSIADSQYPKANWADGITEFLRKMEYREFILLLEDYWLCRYADVEGISKLYSAVVTDSTILRFDLTADRQYAGGMQDVGYWDRFDIIEAQGSQYQMSLQTAVWKTKLFLDVLDDLPVGKRSAWDVELEGTNIVNERKYKVYGTRQWPLRYANGLNNALGRKAILNGLTMDDIESIIHFIPEDCR